VSRTGRTARSRPERYDALALADGDIAREISTRRRPVETGRPRLWESRTGLGAHRAGCRARVARDRGVGSERVSIRSGFGSGTSDDPSGGGSERVACVLVWVWIGMAVEGVSVRPTDDTPAGWLPSPSARSDLPGVARPQRDQRRRFMFSKHHSMNDMNLDLCKSCQTFKSRLVYTSGSRGWPSSSRAGIEVAVGTRERHGRLRCRP